MSEPSQLFVQIRISKEAFDRFLLHKVVPPSHFDDWEGWLSTTEYYGSPITHSTIDTFDKRAGNWNFTINSWLRNWIEADYPDYYPPIINHYDEQTQTWTLAVPEFSENYGNFIVALNTLRQIAWFKNIDSSDYILIFRFFFGDGTEAPDAVMKITPNSSEFVSSIPEDTAQVANTLFARYLAEQEDD